MNTCLICQRIQDIQENTNPYFVAELETGYVVLADHQTYKGYTLFLCKKHVHELHELDDAYLQKFLDEMSTVAKAVYSAFHPDKLNYEMLGNTDPHAHWHLIPRMKTDQRAETGIWAVPKEMRSYKPTKDELSSLKARLLAQLEAAK